MLDWSVELVQSALRGAEGGIPRKRACCNSGSFFAPSLARICLVTATPRPPFSVRRTRSGSSPTSLFRDAVSNFLPKQKQDTFRYPVLFWRRRWDSNPRPSRGIMISSHVRYDHFDTSPYMLTFNESLTLYYSIVLITDCPLCPDRVPKTLSALRAKVLTSVTPFCSLHRPQDALANVPTSILLHIIKLFSFIFLPY